MSGYPCPSCRDCELETREEWLHCLECGRAYNPEDIAAFWEEEDARQEAAAIDRALAACWAEQTKRRPNASGGGDDGLAMTDDYPVVDDSVVCVVRIEHTQRLTRVVRLKRLAVSVRLAQQEYQLVQKAAEKAKKRPQAWMTDEVARHRQSVTGKVTSDFVRQVLEASLRQALRT